ncbi:MAG: indole-3-glycerol phosphate synthase TrpC [Clostridiales bacterium]|nr:indole-3-glycerol phosphate synthase TrpC [Clostridiales bacterium]
MILDKIAAGAYKRVENAKKEKSLKEIEKEAYGLALEANGGFPFAKALKKAGLSFICEIKRASPSKGVIADGFPYTDIAKEYAAAGADAVSVLTEPEFFLGRDEYLTAVSRAVNLPLLRKDFIVDEYQIYVARLIGASAVLLISALLNAEKIGRFLEIARNLGLSVLAETHSREEIDMALDGGAEIIGVNNRDLRTFEVDLRTSERLRPFIPKSATFVSESGIKSRADVEFLEGIGADAVLIGEYIMRANDKSAYLKELKGYKAI